MEDRPDQVRNHYSSVAKGYSDQYRRGFSGYPANQKRLELLVKRVKELKVGTLLDCGCGEGTPMLGIHEAGAQVWGFDLSEEMVEEARTNLASRGLHDRVWQGNVSHPSAFRPATADVPATFDVTMAMGVLPHIEDEIGAIGNMAAATRPGGRVWVEFRNELFSLFTLNRYSYEFFVDKLIGTGRVTSQHPEYRAQLQELGDDLKRFFRLDLPPLRTGTADAPGYDEILSRFHNPFEVGDLFAKAGLRTTDIHFYHFHAAPPMYESTYPELFRDLSLDMERDHSDWRGYFMASAFVVEAVKEEVSR